MAEDLNTPSNTLVKVRWQEPYVSEGLNKKLNGLVPHGVIRGGRLGTSALDSTVVVEADDDTGDSIYSVIDADGHQLTFRQVGNVSLDLDVGTLPGTTAYIGLDVTYSTGSATTVKWKGYTSAEIDADPTIVCLGSAVVPAVAAVIPASDISGDRRSNAGLNIAAGMRDWRQVLVNSSFEGHEVTANLSSGAQDIFGWNISAPLNGELHFLTPSSTPAANPRTGKNNVILDGGGAGSHTCYISPRNAVRVAPGQMVRASVWVRGDSVTMGSGAAGKVGIQLDVRGWNGGSLATYDIEEDGTTITGTFDYVEIAQTIKMPADAAFVAPQIKVTETTSLAGDIGFDDFRLWLEPGPAVEPYDDSDVFGSDFTTKNLIVSPHFNQLAVTNPQTQAERSLSFSCESANPSSLEYSLKFAKAAVTSFLMSLPKGRLALGSDLVSTAAEGIIARLSTNLPVFSNARYVLLWEMNTLGTGDNIRLYGTDQTNVTNPVVGSRTSEAFVITHNAEWTGTQWQYDGIGAAQRFEFGDNGLYFSQKESGGTSPWDDTDWEDNTEAYRYFGVQRAADGVSRITANDARFQILNATTTGSNPGSSDAIPQNTLYAKSMCKAWAKILTGVAQAIPVIRDGFGLSNSTAPAYNGSSLDISIENAFISSNEWVGFANVNSSILLIPKVLNNFNNKCTITVYNPAVSFGTPYDLTAGVDIEIDFVAFGTQT